MNFKEIIAQQMLSEAKLDAFYNRYSDLATPEQMQKIHDNSLPESNKSNEAMDLLMRHLKANPTHLTGLTAEDAESNLPTVARNLINSHGYLKNLNIPSIKKHLGQYSDLGELYKSMDRHIDPIDGDVLPEYQKSKMHKKGTEHVFEDDSVIIRKHNSQESMEKAAFLHPQNAYYHSLNRPGKTNWCVSMEGAPGLSHYNHYSDNGKYPFYTVETKDSKHRKFAIDANESHIHAGEESIWNEPDSPISIGELHDIAPSVFKNHELGNYLRKFPYGKVMDGHPEHITDVINKNELGIENSLKLVVHPSLTKHYLNSIIQNNSEDSEYSRFNKDALVTHLISNPNTDSDVLHTMLKHFHNYGYDEGDRSALANAIVDSPSFNKTHIDRIIHDNITGSFVDTDLHHHPALTEEHMDTLLGHGNLISYNIAKVTKNLDKAFSVNPFVAMRNVHMNSDFINRKASEILQGNKDKGGLHALAGSDKLNEELTHKILDTDANSHDIVAVSTKHASVQDRIASYKLPASNAVLLSNNNLHPEVFHSIMNHMQNDSNMRDGVLRSVQSLGANGMRKVSARVSKELPESSFKDHIKSRIGLYDIDDNKI